VVFLIPTRQKPEWYLQLGHEYRHVSFYAISFLSDLALIPPENLHYFSNLCDNFQCNVIWHS
jgi:hypothetical protein